MFSRIDRRARMLLLRSFNAFAPFIEAVEYVVLHFIQVSIGHEEADCDTIPRRRCLPLHDGCTCDYE